MKLMQEGTEEIAKTFYQAGFITHKTVRLGISMPLHPAAKRYYEQFQKQQADAKKLERQQLEKLQLEKQQIDKGQLEKQTIENPETEKLNIEKEEQAKKVVTEQQ